MISHQEEEALHRGEWPQGVHQRYCKFKQDQVVGPSIHNHLHNVLPPLLLAASSKESSPAEVQAASSALAKVAGVVGEEGMYLLIGELEKALEDPSRRLAAADCLKVFCGSSRLDFQEHVPSLITVSSRFFSMS